MIRIFRINTGSCGGCDLLIGALPREEDDIALAASPFEADVLILTGPLLGALRPAARALLSELGGHVPIVAVGGCALDGAPFGRGGIAENPEIVAAVEVRGCPPAPAAIAAAIREAAGSGARR
jgi:Ni,Fe-hydrogenase III small subunit